MDLLTHDSWTQSHEANLSTSRLVFVVPAYLVFCGSRRPGLIDHSPNECLPLVFRHRRA